jgi:hypothetical protein
VDLLVTALALYLLFVGPGWAPLPRAARIAAFALGVGAAAVWTSRRRAARDRAEEARIRAEPEAARGHRAVRPESDADSFPDVVELRGAGWKFGTEPSWQDLPEAQRILFETLVKTQALLGRFPP